MRECLRYQVETTIRRILAVVGISFLSFQMAPAGTVHIRYPADAPEKLAEKNVHYYDKVAHVFEAHPTWFEHAHPFYTKMFHNELKIEKLTARWEAHEQRFEYWHWCLWKVLDGYGYTHPVAPIQSEYTPPIGQSPAQILPPASGGGSATPPGSVPEPSSLYLLLVAVIAGSAAFPRRWIGWHFS